jgi:NADPH:quinone reductase-like Zn-dependent oxidoreductase
MKAAICTRYGSPEVIVIQDLPKPFPSKHQILVKVIATAVNSGDVRTRSLDVKGVFKFLMRIILGWSKPRKPILGTVFAGIVENVGSNVSKFKTGEKVFGMTGFQFGTHAEYIVVSEKSHVLSMPKNAGFEEAAAIIFGGQTALYYLDKARVREKTNPKILILGATGSVGTSAIQIAKYYNAQITALCSSQGFNLVKKLGVDNIIQYDKEGLVGHTEKYDVIFDAVGKYTKKQCKHFLNKNGIFTGVSIGYASEKLHQLQRIKDLFEKEQLKAVIDKFYYLDEITQAHQYVDMGRKKGNVVIKVNY